MQYKLINRVVSCVSLGCCLLLSTTPGIAKSLPSQLPSISLQASVTKEAQRYEPHEHYASAIQAFRVEHYTKALGIFSELAKSGHVESQYYLAVMYDSGAGVDEDHQQAAIWYQKAAQRNHAEAQYNLAIAYAVGEGLNQDMKQAIYWMKKSALQGNINSQYNLGLIYILGSGVQVNMDEGILWWRLAAGNGDNMAQYNLGMMYLQGRGVENNVCTASRWWKISAENGFTQSRLALQALREQKMLSGCGGMVSSR